MLKTGKVKLYLISNLAIVFALMIFSSSIVAGDVDSFSEIQEKLAGISEEEREILQNLFVLVQEIEEIERTEDGITRDIEIINRDFKDLEVVIAGEEIAYNRNRDALEQLLKSYQRRGPGSYLEIILDSDNLTMFLRRINTLRDLTRNTGELMELLKESRENLSNERTKLAEKLMLMESKQEQVRESLARKLQLKEDMEEYMASLGKEREYYQEHLANIQLVWDELKPLFSETIKEFSRIIEEGNLPSNALKITFTLHGIKGSIDEEAFNDIIKGHPRLPEMVFSFYTDKIEMRLPEKNLVLAGTFIILEEHILKFDVEEGSFYGMPLETETIEELFHGGYLELNLKPLVGNNTLHSIEVLEGNLELQIIPVFQSTSRGGGKND